MRTKVLSIVTTVDEASVIENAKMRVYSHVYSDSDGSDVKNAKHLGYSVDCKVTYKLCSIPINQF
jgi:hypothetical protein